MKENKSIKIFLTVLIIASVWVTSGKNTDAYKLNGYKFSNPKNITYSMDRTMENSKYKISTNIETWKTKCSNKVGFQKKATSTNANIKYISCSSINNGNYAVCSHNSNTDKVIRFYGSFFNAGTTDSQRNEVIVHETGHALGLAHSTAPVSPSIAVMRATGFNGKAYPLSDDIKGISAIYK